MSSKPQPNYDHLDTESERFIHATIATQDIIGWDNFFQARLSTTWHLVQPTPHKYSSNTWIKLLTTWIWNLLTDCWASRNTLLFGKTTTSKRKVNLYRLEAKVREIYTECFQLPTAHRQHTQFIPLEALLKTHPKTLTMWLTQSKQTMSEVGLELDGVSASPQERGRI
jgi:hypothetical protein